MRLRNSFALLLFLIIFRSQSIIAQSSFWGLSSSGGVNGRGALFQYNPAIDIFTIEHSFNYSDGSHPYGSLLAVDSLLWGVTYDGGDSGNGNGVLFSYAPATHIYQKRKDFNLTDGAYPVCEPMLYGNKLWGMTEIGGNNNDGVIYTYDPNTSIYSKVYDFDSVNGANPFGQLIEFGGTLYGCAHNGGANNSGVLFSYNPAAGIYTKLADFPADNPFPIGRLVVSNHALYGLTQASGAGISGSIFKYDFENSSLSVAYQCTPASGSPGGSCYLVAVNDSFYGLNASPGVLYRFTPASGTFTHLHDFDSAGGYCVEGSLLNEGDKLYGCTALGGANGYGVIFEYDKNTGSYTVMHNFQEFIHAQFCQLIRYQATSTGTNNLTSGAGLKVWPNPTAAVLYVDIPTPYCTLTLYNALGQISWRSSLTTGHNTIDLASLPKGIYNCVIQDAGKEMLWQTKISLY